MRNSINILSLKTGIQIFHMMTFILKNITAKILLVIFLVLIPLQSTAQNIPFSRLTTENGLSNSVVNCLLQDRTGFIWFGTDDGLNRFDGYEVKVYRSDPDNEFSLSENIIWALTEDHSGNLWIGTKSGGLNKYDPLTNKFEHWELDSASVEEINITYIYEDSKNNIWIGTYRNGLYRFNTSQNKFEHWQNNSKNPDVLSNNYITSVVEDSKSNIWIATYAGLDKFIPEQTDKPFKKVFTDFNNPIWYLTKSSFIENTIRIGAFNGLFNFDPVNESFSEIILPESSGLKFGNSVSSIAEVYYLGEKILWVGTYGGLVQINLTTGLEKRFLQTKKGDSEIVSNQIHDLIVDRSGVLWIATENGLNFYSQKRSKFNLVASAKPLPEILQHLSGKNVRAVKQTTDESLWFGTDAGLFGVRNTAKDFTIIQNSELMSLNVWSLFKGSSANLWIGTYGQGLKELNLKTNELKSRNVHIPDFNSPGLDYVKTILEDKKGMIWMGFWGGGLARLNTLTSKVKHWRNETDNPFSLSYNDVWAVFEDRKGRIWVG
ncbi:MAG TPA: two-component regulator propeller domain-containing protein, partial [Ignavibacteriaceae bacterium]|nr:two-component regulator propeller domain-containing protein [Ignavibacteriaceae bacterium]